MHNKIPILRNMELEINVRELTEEEFFINVAPAAEGAEGVRDLEAELKEKVNWRHGWTVRNLGGRRYGEEAEDDARRRVMESGAAWRTASIGRRREIAGSKKKKKVMGGDNASPI